MELIRGIHNLSPKHRGCVATIGNFDGVHRGHLAVLEQSRAAAERLNLPLVAMVFEPQPREFFQADQAPARLYRFRDKAQVMADFGLDRLLCLEFNARLRSLSAEAFIQQVLVDGLQVKYLVVGDDFRFGQDRRGDFALLEEAGRRLGFQVCRTTTFAVDGERVSSTRVRDALSAGDFDLAQRLLGRPYALSGRVIHGRKLGRTIGVPTANVLVGRQVSPVNGVYGVQVTLDRADESLPQTPWLGVANVGMRPTVSGRRAMVETHLFNFDQDIYGKRIRVEFVHRLRDEETFPDLDALRTQIQADIRAAKQCFGL